MLHMSEWLLEKVVVSENIQIFLNPTEEELKLKEELPWLSRTLTLEIILNLNVNSQEAFLDQLYIQFSLLWQVCISEITIDNQT